MRRGLPQLETTWKVPQSKHVELVGFTKTNGDCCMFSYVDFEDEEDDAGMYIVATKNMSILVKDMAHLDQIEGK